MLLLAGNTLMGAIGSAFTYQGRLADGGEVANGSYDLRFSLYDAASEGGQVGLAVTNTSMAISNGVFAVVLDFGTNAFNGESRWLEVAVRKSTNGFTVLDPRQPITSTPYAMTAASLDGPLPEGQLPSGVARLSVHQTFTGSNTFSGVVTANNPANDFVGRFHGDGSGLTNLDTSVVTFATNDLNTALSGQLMVATNDLNAALTTKIAASTNDLLTTSNSYQGRFTGNGAWLTNLVTTKIVAGSGISITTNEMGQTTESITITYTGAGGSATNAVSSIWTNGQPVAPLATNLNLIPGANVTLGASNYNYGRVDITINSNPQTNDLNTALVARITASTNDLSAVLSAQIVAATNSPWIASTNWVVAQGYAATNGLTRKMISCPAPTDGTNYVVDFGTEVVQILATNHITLVQSTNRPGSGWYGECVWYIQGGAADWTLRVNTNWTGVGTLVASTPFVIASNKLAMVALSARGSSETNVTYAIGRQE